MATPNSAPDDGYLALIGIDDIGPLLADHLGIKPSPDSPILGFVSEYQHGSGTLSPEAAQLAAIDLTRTALTVLAHPELFFITLWGGGPVAAVVQEVTCHAPDIEPDAFVSIAPAENGSLVVQLHQSPWEFLARWLNTLASGASETTPNLIPPPVTDEALIYILHTIDAYTRAMMQQRLDHEELDGRPLITPDLFVASLASSLSSGDARWLLPAFLAMTPGVSTKSLGDHESALEQLEVLDFFRTAEDAQGGDLLAFGDAAIVMGEEFSRLWSGSAGFRISLAGDDALIPLASGFLAATALANHLILVSDEQQDDQAVLNHQSLTRDELEGVMAPMLGLALERLRMRGPRSSAAEAQEEEPQGPAIATAATPEAKLQTPVLIGIGGPRAGERVKLGPRTTVGRTADNDLVLVDSTVSGHHAVLTFAAGSLSIEDLGSTNGTWIDGVRVEGQAALTDGADLRLGKAQFTVGLPTAAVAEPPSADQTIAIPVRPQPSPACPACGNKISLDAKFCRSCGHRMAS